MRLKRKIPVFIFGMSIGLVVAVGFFVFKFNEIFNRLKDSAKEQITIIQQPVKTVNVAETDKEKKKDNERFKINLGNNPKVNYQEVDSLIGLKEDMKIKVATDELLSVKNIKVIKIGDNFSGDGKDSMIAELANINNNSSDLFTVEFWKTPLNTKGYRFSKNRIMLYGFVDFNDVVLYQLNNIYYIKASNQIYKLNYGGDFKPLERVSDSDLIAKLS